MVFQGIVRCFKLVLPDLKSLDQSSFFQQFHANVKLQVKSCGVTFSIQHKYLFLKLCIPGTAINETKVKVSHISVSHSFGARYSSALYIGGTRRYRSPCFGGLYPGPQHYGSFGTRYSDGFCVAVKESGGVLAGTKFFDSRVVVTQSGGLRVGIKYSDDLRVAAEQSDGHRVIRKYSNGLNGAVKQSGGTCRRQPKPAYRNCADTL